MEEGCFRLPFPGRFLATSCGSLKELLRLTGEVVSFVIRFRVDFNMEAVPFGEEAEGEDFFSAETEIDK